MDRTLTILIPNYNRPQALRRLLGQLAVALDKLGSVGGRVCVLVVDDYSDQDIDAVFAPFRGRENFSLKLQSTKCGNAETAFLSALPLLKSEYVWLLGNDDQISTDGLAYLIQVLGATDVGFILLNPAITKTTTGATHVPLTTTTPMVYYDHTEDLFFDFGFVTSTTTFPCLLMKVAPIRNFHRRHGLNRHSAVYSHTFTIFGALRLQPALVISTPVVKFTLNERLDEHEKLFKQAPAGIEFFHQTLGLARLINATAQVCGIGVERLGGAFEDEVDKDTLRVVPTLLSHFLVFFTLQQLAVEQAEVAAPRAKFGHLVASEFDELRDLIARFGDTDLHRLFEEAAEVLWSPNATPAWKMHYLHLAEQRLRKLVDARYASAIEGLPIRGAKKIAPDTFSLTPLRGAGADAAGFVLRPGYG